MTNIEIYKGVCECCGKEFKLTRYGAAILKKRGRKDMIRAWLKEFRERGGLPEVDRDAYEFRPHEGEKVHCLIKDVRLYESRQVGWSQSHSEGTVDMSFDGDFASGVSSKVSMSQSGTNFEAQFVCVGKLILTNERVLFVGNHNRIFGHGDIVSFESRWKSKKVMISADGFEKGMEFSGNKVAEFALYYTILTKPKFREMLMVGKESDVIEKLMKMGLFYTPAPPSAVGQDNAGCAAVIVILLACVVALIGSV